MTGRQPGRVGIEEAGEWPVRLLASHAIGNFAWSFARPARHGPLRTIALRDDGCLLMRGVTTNFISRELCHDAAIVTFVADNIADARARYWKKLMTIA